MRARTPNLRQPRWCTRRPRQGERSRAMNRRADVRRNTTPEVPQAVHSVLSSSGAPLEAATRTRMECLFGQDFTQVRVHTDDRAAESARAGERAGVHRGPARRLRLRPVLAGISGR
ncbi:eCIS core domain-containing protein [Allokutzneria sp. A3M-2-11 16]|uniref:eCIS core domain-containing protein n=1 Tax=Allokutzneria sp. A3M-2-11 16 TaxID=2962043 RepID=UPI0027E2A8D6|nr:DUF4157 domain-containing protein [Allokutzneria sp. A3M-2-11 16]